MPRDETHLGSTDALDIEPGGVVKSLSYPRPDLAYHAYKPTPARDRVGCMCINQSTPS